MINKEFRILNILLYFQFLLFYVYEREGASERASTYMCRSTYMKAEEDSGESVLLFDCVGAGNPAPGSVLTPEVGRKSYKPDFTS